jgi:uncharacterized membrane protein
VQNSARVPLSTYLMLLGLMVAFLGVSFDVVFFAAWAWWAIPTAGVIAFVVGASMKSAERRRRREQIEDLDREYTR